ncbi:CHAT domain-containing protein [Phormidium tenue FACHB-886]|nr:CHAT domain-containing protein [Phormidium tenue FACHB-886]
MKRPQPRHRFPTFLKWLTIGLSLVLGLEFSQGRAELMQAATLSTPAAQLQSSQLLPPSSQIDFAQLVQQGKEYYQAGQFAQAAELWQQAAAGYQARGDDRNQALALSNLSSAQQQLGLWSEAEQNITMSLSLLQTPRSAQSDRLVFAQALNTQGSLQFAQGQIEQALDTWKQAAATYAEAGDPDKRLANLLNQAQAQQSLGLFLQAKQTLNEVERSLQQQPDSLLKAAALRALGDGLRSTGNLENARRVLEQSLAIAQLFDSPTEIGATLLSLGNVARSQQDRTAALKFYQQAALTAPSLIQLQSNLNQFSLLIETEQGAPAQSLLPEIQAQLAALSASRAVVYARINFALSLARWRAAEPSVRPVQTAAQALAVAVEQARSLKDIRAEAYALGNLGSIYEQTQQWSEAQALTERALLIAQAVNAADIAYQWQWQLGRLLKAQGQPAIAAYQAAFQTLQSVRKDLLATNPDLQFSFREKVEPVYRELVDLLLRRSSSSQPDQINLKQARQVIESLQLAELDNFFRTACLEGQAVAIDQIEESSAAVIYPIILQDRLEIILSLPGQPLYQYTAAVSQPEVEETLMQLRQNLEKPFTTSQGKRLGQQVYDWLIQPIAAELQEKAITTLSFVLDGAFRNVPMAALYDGSQYLIENYSIALTPGLQLFNPTALERNRLQALMAGLTEERNGFSALANVQRELQSVQTEIPGQILLNETFTSATLQAEIKSNPFSIVHLATHGQFSSNADATFVLAWDKPITVKELGSLLRTTDETREKAIELLVLSACETASGDDRAALGLAGVAVQSGARSTLASLWSLNDESAARLISQFYRELVPSDLSKAEVLRQAQLSLLHDPNYRHPLYWAPYVLVGNWL